MSLERESNPQSEQFNPAVNADLNDGKKVSREEAARKGGQAVSRDRAHMAEIGRKGGQAVSRNREHMARIGRKGGESVSRDRAHMAQIGQKGGERRGIARKSSFGDNAPNPTPEQNVAGHEEFGGNAPMTVPPMVKRPEAGSGNHIKAS